MKTVKDSANWYDSYFSARGRFESYSLEDYVRLLAFAYGLVDLPVDERRIVDIGCGNGDLLWVASKLNNDKLWGIDISFAALRALTRRVPSAELVAANGERLPFGNESFDLIIALGSLEHFPDPRKGVSEMMRVIRRSGAALVLMPSPYWPYMVFSKLLGGYKTQPIEHLWSIGRWAKVFVDQGCKVEITKPVYPHSEMMLNATSLPWVRILYRPFLPIMRLYDRIRDYLPSAFAYHVAFVLRKE